MKLFKTVFLVGLATIALGSAAMGDGNTPTAPATANTAVGSEAPGQLPCTAGSDKSGGNAGQGTGGVGGTTPVARPAQ